MLEMTSQASTLSIHFRSSIEPLYTTRPVKPNIIKIGAYSFFALRFHIQQ